MVDVITKYLCDCCGSEMPSIKYLDDLIPKSATKVWNLKGFDICPICALKIDNELLKLQLHLLNR